MMRGREATSSHSTMKPFTFSAGFGVPATRIGCPLPGPVAALAPYDRANQGRSGPAIAP